MAEAGWLCPRLCWPSFTGLDAVVSGIKAQDSAKENDREIGIR